MVFSFFFPAASRVKRWVHVLLSWPTMTSGSLAENCSGDDCPFMPLLSGLEVLVSFTARGRQPARQLFHCHRQGLGGTSTRSYRHKAV